MQVQVLGTIEVVDPADVALGGPTQRRVLSSLVLNADQVVSVDQLVDAVWPDGDVPERAEHNVRTYVHRLRTALDGSGERIETAGTGYRLRLARDELDAAQFEDLVVEARAAASEADNQRARALLDQAFELWGGRPYDEFADEEWARAEVARLGELRASALEHRFAALLDEGRHTEVVGSLQDAVTDEPWREARRMQLALALYRSGRQAEALRSIQSYRSDLADELGLEPSPELDRLEHQILDHDPALLPASHQQHMLRGYQLDEVMGEGAFSLVWRGAQPTLGRTVAIKQIRAELANQPDFVRRFETEAQTVAALEHPHIVPLYDYWREPDGAYLVMRYVAGGTLESSVLDGGLVEPRLRRFVDHVGSALGAAHRAGVIHRDVKSANVLIDGDENFYLTDFGIALTGSVADDEMATALSTGSPAYASPEQLRRQPLDARTDVYGFGITLFEAATGRLPFVDAPTKAALVKRQLEDPVPAPTSVTPGLPTWVDHVVARATAKNPSDRFASMADLIASIPSDATSATDPGLAFADATVIGTLVNPFKALQAFGEADAADFHGRGRLVARFVEVLAGPGSAGRLLAVVGPSGSGKSSAVRSGLLPALRAGDVPGSQNWFITTMMPGHHPFEELESALSRVAVRQPGPLVEIMSADDRGIARAINQVLPEEDSELLLVIDQFEELFTHVDDATRTKFVDSLMATVKEPRARLRVVLTIRADFLDRPLRHPELAARLESATVTVSPLAADELEAAIVEPVRRQGAAYEPGLVARIMADVGDQPGALPLLQYALTELFDRHVSGLLQAQSYDAMGGLTGALAARAESTLTGMSTDQQTLTRRLFGRLVTLGEGTEDTRRRVRMTELGTSGDVTHVIDTFGAARLLVFDHDQATREPTVEIAHEALLHAWPRLRRWLDEDRDGLRIHRHLTDTAASWLSSNQDPGELYRGGRLETASTWATDHRPELNSVESEFLDASVAAHAAELEAEQALFDQQVKSNRRLRMLVTIAAVIAMIAAAAGIFALQQQSRADDEATEARAQATEAEAARQLADANAAEADANAAKAEAQEVAATRSGQLAEDLAVENEARAVEAEAAYATADLQRLRSSALSEATENPALGILLATEAYRIDPSRASQDVLHRTLTAVPGFRGQIAIEGELFPLAIEGSTMTYRDGDAFTLWDLESREMIRRVPYRNTTVELFAVSEDATLAAATGTDGTRLIDLTSEAGTVLGSADVAARGLTISPQGDKILMSVWDEGIQLRSVPDLELISVIPVTNSQSVAFSRNGERVATMGFFDGTITMWDLATGAPLWSAEPPFPVVAGNNWGLVFSRDGERLVTKTRHFASPELACVACRNTELFRSFDAATGNLIGQVETEGGVFALLDDRGERLVTTTPTGIVVIDMAEQREVDLITPGNSVFTDLYYNPELDRVITFDNAAINLWSVDGSSPLQRLIRLPPDQEAAAANNALFSSISPDGTRLRTSVLGAFPDAVFDLTADPPIDLDDPWNGYTIGYGEYTLMFVPDDELGAAAVLTDWSGRRLGKPWPFSGDEVMRFDASEDGRFIALWKTGGVIEVIRSDGSLAHTLKIPKPDDHLEALRGGTVTLSADGELVAAEIRGSWAWAVWSTSTGELVASGAPPGHAYVRLAGDRLFAHGLPPATLNELDPATLEPIRSYIGHSSDVVDAVVDETTDRVATRANDGTVRVWNGDSGEQFGRELPAGPANSLEWAANGTVLKVPMGDRIAIWNYDTSTWADIACEVAGRNLTADEWDQFGPETTPYRKTCDQLPLDT